MGKKAPPVSHRFWCSMDSEEDESPLCSKCGRAKLDIGWRVGWGTHDYVWYSTPPKVAAPKG